MSAKMNCSSQKAESRIHCGERSREHVTGRVVVDQDPGFRGPLRALQAGRHVSPGLRREALRPPRMAGCHTVQKTGQGDGNVTVALFYEASPRVYSGV